MPRDLALGNGRLLVTFDGTYTLRDFYYPHVGKKNHTIGHPCRTGVWVDGQFAWFSDSAWCRSIRYRPNSLVSDVMLQHAGLGLRIHATDAVHPERTCLVRSFQVTNQAAQLREVRMLFHHDFHIGESEIGDTACFEPVNRFLIHYKERNYFLINGRTGDGQGIFQYATGQKETTDKEGTWRDAEDGWLEMTPISQGSVDSTVSFRQNIAPGQTGRFLYWIAAETGYWEAKELNAFVSAGHESERVAMLTCDGVVAVQSIIEQTDEHWRAWIGRAPTHLADLPKCVQELHRRSLLLINSQTDHDGAIIAANDGDSMANNRDTYSYMWPRDGALVAHTLDRCGYNELTERFFRFCNRLMPKPSYYPDGYLLHKFNPDGSVGSSWHPWVRDGRPSLPVQEDETALVLWAFWHHFEHRRPDPEVYNLVRELAATLVIPAARFMVLYRDEPEGRERFKLAYQHPPTGLPLASYDLWEERYGIHSFTVAATCAGLQACAKFLRLMLHQRWAMDEKWCREAVLLGENESFDSAQCHERISVLEQRCVESAQRMKMAFQHHFWLPDRQSYGRMLNFDLDGRFDLDRTLDASTLYGLLAFGVFQSEDSGVRETIAAIDKRLWCKTSIGGIARYENDYYHRQSDDIENVPGSPWFICTLWGALGQIFLAQSLDDLRRPREILEWVCGHAQPSGVLAEQVHPYTGAPMSVAPLTWSHAAFVETVLAYSERHAAIG
jgi:GH15 family glucan-1,4-alpha-glucosidase